MYTIQNRRQAFSSPVGGLRKIREVIGNSLAFKRTLLRSLPPLACGEELSSKQNAEKLPRHASDACTANPLAGTISCHAPRISLCARPARAAASSCRTFALHRCPGAPVRTTLRPLNDPSESPPSPSGNSGCAPSAQPAELLPCSLTPTTVGQHCGNSGELISCAYGSHEGNPS